MQAAATAKDVPGSNPRLCCRLPLEPLRSCAGEAEAEAEVCNEP